MSQDIQSLGFRWRLKILHIQSAIRAKTQYQRLTLISTSCLKTVNSSGATASASEVVAINIVGNPEAMVAVLSLSTTDDKIDTSDCGASWSAKLHRSTGCVTYLYCFQDCCPSFRSPPGVGSRILKGSNPPPFPEPLGRHLASWPQSLLVACSHRSSTSPWSDVFISISAASAYLYEMNTQFLRHM